MTENTAGTPDPASENPERAGDAPTSGSADAGAGATGAAADVRPGAPTPNGFTTAAGWPANVPPRPQHPSVTPNAATPSPFVAPAAPSAAARPTDGPAVQNASYMPGPASAGHGAPLGGRNQTHWNGTAPSGAGSSDGPSHSGFGSPTFGPASAPASRQGPKRRSGSTMLVAGLAIGALVGGASGAGAFAIMNGMPSPAAITSGATGTQNITINDTENVNRTTAVAAKASPSVVTLAVAGGEGSGTGSGIILSEDGYVLTNNHVVTLDGSVADPAIQVTDSAGKLYSATIVGTDPVFDLAVIKLDGASGLTKMEIADSSKLNVGDTVVAIGAPLGLAGTVTDGIISALNRSITVASSAVPDSTENEDGSEGGDTWGFEIPGQEDQGNQATASISLPVVQTDAAINPGNSGGALVNDNGELVGVNVAIASAGSSSGEQSGSIGVGFAIPSTIAERIANEIIESGSASHGLLGATVGDSSSVEGSTVSGALIDQVSRDGAAANAGIRSGDVITSFNGVPVTGATDLTAQVRALAAGSTATVVYQRDGKEYTVEVTLGELQL